MKKMLTKLFAKEYGINKYVRKNFGGHSIKDLTDRVYTHMDIEWFRTEIEKISYVTTSVFFNTLIS